MDTAPCFRGSALPRWVPRGTCTAHRSSRPSIVTVALWRQGRIAPSWYFYLGGLLVGWGLFNLLEGLVDHELLRIHHLRDDLGGPLSWDLGPAVVLIVVGWKLMQRGRIWIVMDHLALRDAAMP